VTLPPVIYFGNDWFADNRTSSHHVARQLARHTRVLYMEVPGLRPPQMTSRDVRRIATKLTRALRRHVAEDGRIVVRTLPQLPWHHSALARSANRMFSAASVAAALRRERMTRPIVWCTVPIVANLVGLIPKSLLVYHCIDDYSALPGVDRAAVKALDDQLGLQADLVVAASQPVFDSKRSLRGERPTLLMPHGVDVRHFAKAQTEPASMPPELAGLPRPFVSFTGLIERWVDLELVGWLAEQLPRVTFVMIGRIAVPRKDVPTAPNIVYLGPRPYETLPTYGHFFDAAILPYRLNDQLKAANPLKLREYLAMGVPIVSVSTPEIDRFAEVVAITHSREEFLAALVRALESPQDRAAVQRRMDAVADSSWESRVDGLLSQVTSLLPSPVERQTA
jgi:glycosyltransferase involved in cell wall biosynthesis